MNKKSIVIIIILIVLLLGALGGLYFLYSEYKYKLENEKELHKEITSYRQEQDNIPDTLGVISIPKLNLNKEFVHTSKNYCPLPYICVLDQSISKTNGNTLNGYDEFIKGRDGLFLETAGYFSKKELKKGDTAYIETKNVRYKYKFTKLVNYNGDTSNVDTGTVAEDSDTNNKELNIHYIDPNSDKIEFNLIFELVNKEEVE